MALSSSFPSSPYDDRRSRSRSAGHYRRRHGNVRAAVSVHGVGSGATDQRVVPVAAEIGVAACAINSPQRVVVRASSSVLFARSPPGLQNIGSGASVERIPLRRVPCRYARIHVVSVIPSIEHIVCRCPWTTRTSEPASPFRVLALAEDSA